MRFVGQNSSFHLRACGLGLLLLLAAAFAAPLHGQTAPYVLPYTMSTYAGPHAAYTIGAACTPSVTGAAGLLALDTAGDGCLAAQVEVGSDPHDIRVDGKGNVYWIDDGGSQAVIHKILAATTLETAYIGNVKKTKPCSVGDTYGDGCTSTDNAANTGTLGYTTTNIPKSRGLAISYYGDLFLADYNGNYDHRVSSSGTMSVIAGTGTAASSTAPLDGPVGTSQVNATRGIGVDSSTGVVYIADTGDSVLRMATPTGTSCTGQPVDSCYTTSTVTKLQTNPATAGQVVSGVPASQELLDAPEDAQVDSNGNVFIAQQANNVIMAIYNGGSPFFGISNPQKGYIYLIAGSTTAIPTGTGNTSYPADGSTPSVPATSVNIGTRKIGLDIHGDLYIADSSYNVVWFVDHATGYMRLIAGHFQPLPAGGVTTPPTPIGCPASAGNSVGDGCPGPQASIYASSDMANAADNQGNLYITDAEGGVPASSRIRKLLSGLNFPALATGSSVTQNIAIHFAPNDTPAANAFSVNNPDYTIGTPSCTVEADHTDDCILPVTFRPTVSGYDTATLTMTSAAGGVNSYVITGTGTSATLAFDPGNAALFSGAAVNAATGVVMDAAGNAFIADTANNRVLKYSAATQAVTVVAGTGAPGYTGDNAAATAATLKAPTAVAVDTSGSLYIADTGNNVIRKVSASGIITTYAGGAAGVCSMATNAVGDGCAATSATLRAPSGIAADNLGQLYISDTGNNLIRQVNVYGYISTLAGGATGSTTCTNETDTFGDGCAAAQTIFNAPGGLAFDATGNDLIVADTGNSIVRQIFLANKITSDASGNVTAATVNPVTLIAGTGSAGNSIDVNSSAALSQLNKPAAVAVDAAENVYIADTGNHAVRLVTHAAGTISTIVGINGASGNTAFRTSPLSATSVLLNSPAGIAVSGNGTLLVADTGNSRLLTDARAQISYNFGVLSPNTSSPAQTFTEVSIGNATATLASPLVTATGDTSQFAFTEPTGSAGCAANEALAPGAACSFQGQFNPTTTGQFSATYTETGTVSSAGTPSIKLIGIAAVLSKTTSAVAQTSPATGNSQYGGSVTLSVTVSSACNIAAPSCYPSGAVQLIVDGVNQAPQTLNATGSASQSFTGLAVGPHTVSCIYSGDTFYGASTCPAVTITVGPASTTSLLSASNNNQQQYPSTACSTITAAGPTQGDTLCNATTLTATVVSNTTGVPTGTVNFFATGGNLSPSPYPLGSAPINSTTGVANLTLSYITDPNGNLVADTSLPPGTYQLTCSYSGASNFASSNCAPTSYTVVSQPSGFTLTPVGCVYNDLYIPGTNTSGKGVTCQPVAQATQNGFPIVATADGSTSDVTIFINPSNSFSGTITFSCSGLPQYSVCTFSPTSIKLTAGTAYASPVYTDMTLWTDIQPGTVPTASLRSPSIGSGRGGVAYAMMIGWPLTLLGLAGLFRLRRKPGTLRGLTLIALLFVMAGSSLLFTGCAGGPGAYHAVLTPAGTYPITVTATGNGTTQTTTVYFKVASPGIPGQQ